MGIERAMFHLTYLLAITGTSTSRKLDGFRTLADGWHYGNGGPIAEEQIREAKKMLQFMNMIGFTRTDAFASGDGEILLTAYHEKNYLGVVLEENQTFSFTHELDGQECYAAENVTVLEAKKLLLTVAGEVWPISAWSTPGISTPFAASLTSLHSGSLLMGACLSLREPVLKPQAA